MHTTSNRPFLRVAAALAAIAAISPALAAPAVWPIPMPFTSGGMTLNDWILTGSLALLAVAMALRLMRRGPREPVMDGPDLRWWRNP